MNQLLVTQKLYVTPELRRKKKLYKWNFIICMLVLIGLTATYVSSIYAKTAEEKAAKALLDKALKPDETAMTSNILIAALDNTGDIFEIPPIDLSEKLFSQTHQTVETTASGYEYQVQAVINIPKINVNYSVLLGKTGSESETEALLELSPTRFWGSEPNEVGNYCIAGHNYRNSMFFSKVPTLEMGDLIEITDMKKGRTITYGVYEIKTVEINDVSDTTQKTNGNKEITLITCTDDNSKRYIIKAREIE